MVSAVCLGRRQKLGLTLRDFGRLIKGHTLNLNWLSCVAMIKQAGP